MTRHRDGVARLGWRLLAWSDPEEVEEVVQEVFVRAFEKLPRYRGEAALSTWLGGITLNVCRGRARAGARRRRRERNAARSERLHHDPAATLEQVDRQEALRAALASLPARQREVLVLHYYEDQAPEAIARLLGIRRNTVDARLSRARRRLAGLLGESLEEGA